MQDDLKKIHKDINDLAERLKPRQRGMLILATFRRLANYIDDSPNPLDIFFTDAMVERGVKIQQALNRDARVTQLRAEGVENPEVVADQEAQGEDEQRPAGGELNDFIVEDEDDDDDDAAARHDEAGEGEEGAGAAVVTESQLLQKAYEDLGWINGEGSTAATAKI